MSNSPGIPMKVVKVHADGTADLIVDCRSHVDASLWIETGQADAAGNVRVICKLCSKFIGYRNIRIPPAPAVETTTPNVKGPKHGKVTKRR